MLFQAKMKVSHYHDHNLCSIWLYSHSWTEGRSKNCGFVWKRRTCSLLAISRWKARGRISLIQALKRCFTSVTDGLEGNQRDSRENKWLCLKNDCDTSRELISPKDCFKLGWPIGSRTWKYRGVGLYLGFLWSVWPANLNCKSGDDKEHPLLQESVLKLNVAY